MHIRLRDGLIDSNNFLSALKALKAHQQMGPECINRRKGMAQRKKLMIDFGGTKSVILCVNEKIARLLMDKYRPTLINEIFSLIA